MFRWKKDKKKDNSKPRLDIIKSLELLRQEYKKGGILTEVEFLKLVESEEMINGKI